MAYSAAPRLLIVADSPMQRIAIADAVSRSGFDVLHNIHSDRLKSEHCTLSPTLWLLDVEDEDKVLDLLGDDAPLMVGITPAPPPINKAAYLKWVKSLSAKLNKVLGDAAPLLVFEEEPVEAENQQVDTELKIPPNANPSYITGTVPPNWQYVCVLAASMGGPEAVKRFLDNVPVTLPVAFVLVQHIDPNMQSVLPRVLGRHNGWKFDTEKNFSSQQPNEELRILPNLQLEKGRVLIVPAVRQLDFGDCGEVFAHAPLKKNSQKYKPWPGQYQPSINDVMRRAAEAFRSRLITIVFSGMGDDGSSAVTTVQETRGIIWAQTSGSCICSSQPDNVRASGQVSFNGTPEMLAEHLQQFIAEQSISMS
ncbi:MAG: chemotaxis protein CheB [Candidatus Saccharibacteria bacterium]|nr:chemotaxis protein CheB [Moraxellaceae bacterium]